MNKENLIRRLELGNVKNRVLPISESISILTAQRGGRVLGIFQNGKDENLLWTAPQLEDERTAEKFLKSDIWNYGGDRLWFGPEIRYAVSDRNRFWETLHTPETIDPGNYEMSDDGSIFAQNFELKAKDGSGEKASVCVRKTVQKCDNPLRRSPKAEELMQGVVFGGFSQIVEVSGHGGCVEPWSLLQVTPGGTIYIPMYTPEAGADYYEPAAPFETVKDHSVELCATGCNRYKVGYRATSVTGRLGYACRWNGDCCLLVRNFPNQPEGIYEEEPPQQPGVHGFSVHVYNDGGPENGFAEIECTLPAVLGERGRECSRDTISTWIYVGQEERLTQIGKILLGCEVNF